MLFRSLAVLGLVAPCLAQDFHIEPVEVPATAAEKHSNIGASTVILNDVTYETGYKTILSSGEDVGGVIFGAVLDENHSTVFAYPGHDDKTTAYVEAPLGNNKTTTPLISNIPDFTSLIHTKGGASDFAMFSHFETPLPASIYRINVEFDETCGIVVDSLEAVNFSKWGGVWEPCSAKVTPWNTHMGSEEHEPDAKVMTYDYASFVEAYNVTKDPSALNIMLFMRYYGLYSNNVTSDIGFDKLKAKFNPYKYGHITELSVGEDDKTVVKKWYTTGRVSIENPEIMPDNKTIYIADDADFGVFLKYVMTTPKDMSAGTLYAAKWTQREAIETGTTEISRLYPGVEFGIEWIELGEATQDELTELVKGLTFDKIFVESDLGEDGTCDTDFTYVKAGWSVKEECLQLVDGMEQAAAFFETRRYAAMMGATVEMQSMEGLAVVPDAMKLYASMSKITNGMDATVLDAAGEDGDIALEANSCGCIWEFDVSDDYDLTTARAFACGEPSTEDELNTCSTDGIANPDNLFYMGHVEGGPHRMLIAEDTSGHQNDYMWMYDFDTKEMSKILSSVVGSQVTSPGYFTDGNGCYLLMAVVPHPYKKSDVDMVDDAENTLGLAGSVGYIGPIGTPRDEL